MVKKITLMLIMILALSSFGFADVYLSDEADIFTEDTDIQSQLKQLSEDLGYPVFLVTTNDYYDKSPEDATDDMLYARGIKKGEDALILSINMQSRDIFIMPTGNTLENSSITKEQFAGIRNAVRDKLSAGDYDSAAQTYINETRNTLGDNYLSFTDMIMAAITSLAGVGGYGASQMRKYNPRPRRKPFELYQNTAINITSVGDVLIDSRRHVTVIPKVQKSGGGGRSISRTSSGRTHRGGGGKF